MAFSIWNKLASSELILQFFFQIPKPPPGRGRMAKCIWFGVTWLMQTARPVATSKHVASLPFLQIWQFILFIFLDHVGFHFAGDLYELVCNCREAKGVFVGKLDQGVDEHFSIELFL
jgi:hypothetical protein